MQEIAFILNAVHGLKLVQTFDADVSVELHTNLSWDTDASYQYGKRFAEICPDRFIVKVPLTPEGILAARKLRADGIRINFTLGFSARENYLIAVGAQPNWVNVFMGRCNSFVADAGLGDGTNIGEKATLSSQRTLRRIRSEHGLDVLQIGASRRAPTEWFPHPRQRWRVRRARRARHAARLHRHELGKESAKSANAGVHDRSRRCARAAHWSGSVSRDAAADNAAVRFRRGSAPAPG